MLDAAVAELEGVGKVSLCNYGCLPAYNNNTMVMGDISVLAQVNMVGISDFMFLKTVKYGSVVSAVNFVCEAIIKGLTLKNIYEKNSNKINLNMVE